MPVTKVKVTKALAEQLLEITDALTSQDKISTRRSELTRLNSMAKEYARNAREFSCAKTPAQIEKLKKGGKAQSDKIYVPIIEPELAALTAQLNKTFLTAPEIFTVKMEDGDLALKNEIDELFLTYERQFGWHKAFLKIFKNLATYTYAAVKMEWKSDYVKVPNPVLYNIDGSPETDITSKQDALLKAGVNIEAIDIFNLLVDTNIDISKLAQEGKYVGYMESLNYPQLKKYLDDIDYPLNKDEVFDSYNRNLYYQKPIWDEDFINTYDYVNEYGLSREHIDAMFPDANYPNNSAINIDLSPVKQKIRNSLDRLVKAYTRVNLYIRFVPKDFGISVADNMNDEIQIWKLVYINNLKLVDIEIQDQSSPELPIIIAVSDPTIENIASTSLIDKLASFEALATGMARSEVESTTNHVREQIYYNPKAIQGKHIRDARIVPVTDQFMDQGIASALYKLTHNDPALGSRFGIINQIEDYVSRLTGTNRTQMGQFIPGNKTNAQFQETLQGSSDRQLSLLLGLIIGLFVPLTEKLRTLLITEVRDIKLPSGEVINLTNYLKDNTIQVLDPFTKGKISVEGNVAITYLQLIQSAIPNLASSVDMVKFLGFIGESLGMPSIEQFILKAQNNGENSTAVNQTEGVNTAINPAAQADILGANRQPSEVPVPTDGFTI